MLHRQTTENHATKQISKPEVKTQKGCKMWHLVLTVFVLGLTMRLSLGNLEIPEDQSPHYMYSYTTSPYHQYRFQQYRQMRKIHELRHRFDDPTDTEVFDVMPIDLNGKMQGPLLTSILQQYAPDSKPIHADELRETLPPNADPRMIVILPGNESTEAVY